MSSEERVTGKVLQWEIICCLKTVPPGYQILGTILKVKVKVAQSCLTLCDPMDYTEYWSGQLFPSPGDLPNPGIEPRSSTLQADSLPAELQGKPRDTGVVSLSLLQQIFLTQKLNQGFLHCRRILYQLSYQGSWIKRDPLQLVCKHVEKASSCLMYTFICHGIWICSK